MQCLMINLPASTDRLDFQTAQFARLGLDLTVVPAVFGADIEEAEYQRYAASGTRLITRGELACLLSHGECWKRVIETGEPALVFEDDVVLSEDFADTLPALDAHLRGGPRLVKLEYWPRKQVVSRALSTDPAGRFAIHDVVSMGSGTAAYGVSPEAAKRLLDSLRTQASIADTHIYYVRGVDYAQMVPAPAVQASHLPAQDDLPAGLRQTTINTPKQRSSRPGSLQSFLANPMTRVNRLGYWFKSSRRKLVGRLNAKASTVSLAASIPASLRETMRTING